MPIFGPRYNTCANFITHIGFNFHLTILDPSCWSVLIRTNEFAYYFTGNFDPSARSTTASNASVIDMIKKGRVGAQPNSKFHKSLFFCWMMFHTQLNPQQALCIIILTGGHHKGAEFNSERERERKRVNEKRKKEKNLRPEIAWCVAYSDAWQILMWNPSVFLSVQAIQRSYATKKWPTIKNYKNVWNRLIYGLLWCLANNYAEPTCF